MAGYDAPRFSLRLATSSKSGVWSETDHPIFFQGQTRAKLHAKSKTSQLGRARRHQRCHPLNQGTNYHENDRNFAQWHWNNNDQKAQIDAFKNSLSILGYNTTGANVNLTIVGPLFEDDNPGTLDINADALATTANLDVLVAAGGTRSFVAAQTARMKAGKPNLT